MADGLPLHYQKIDMPANKNAMTRYALIDKMLANRYKSYSIQDITDELADKLPEYGQPSVTKRCVEKDLNYLEFDSPFDVEIEAYWVDAADCNGKTYRKRCVRYADPTFSIFKPKVTDEEKSVLVTALDTLGSFEGLENFEWLSDLKARLDLEEKPPVISISKNILNNSTLIAQLFTAIRLHQVITLKYHTFIDTESKNVDIIPYLLKEYNNRWFLIASACDTRRILTFALDRIEDFVINQRKKYCEQPEDLYERYEDIIGITYDEHAPVEDIIFWVSEKSKDYITTKPIHNSQKIIRNQELEIIKSDNPHLEKGVFFKISCKENYELVRELISLGEDLIVIQPLSLKNKIKEKLKKMTNLYSHS